MGETIQVDDGIAEPMIINAKKYFATIKYRHKIAGTTPDFHNLQKFVIFKKKIRK